MKIILEDCHVDDSEYVLHKYEAKRIHIDLNLQTISINSKTYDLEDFDNVYIEDNND